MISTNQGRHNHSHLSRLNGDGLHKEKKKRKQACFSQEAGALLGSQSDTLAFFCLTELQWYGLKRTEGL